MFHRLRGWVGGWVGGWLNVWFFTYETTIFYVFSPIKLQYFKRRFPKLQWVGGWVGGCVPEIPG
jgi:hypothetical protein